MVACDTPKNVPLYNKIGKDMPLMKSRENAKWFNQHHTFIVFSWVDLASKIIPLPGHFLAIFIGKALDGVDKTKQNRPLS